MSIRVDSPLRDCLEALLGKMPPKIYGFLEGVITAGQLENDEFILLQDWCALNARPSWAMGISLIEAAESLIEDAESNGKISLT